MKLSVESCVPVKRFDVEKGLKMIKGAGFDCVDFSYYWQSPETKEKLFGDSYIEAAKELRKFLENMEKDLLPDALKFAEKIGRHIINKIK